ncbi:MAG: carboxylating nicotinate-nucleotide diphosphorylase [Syntrophomonadaceae bacterium]|jgi:nicotinate-nucleotide pyrophosphorylase (carboxylating)|nr:carboxylating nicotinate-nucleotide diphosphorylase [Syntrophomonadaceae bacterium]MDH7497938.1 carboxylating nicotinate-nucleotide diphosphorylase [Syntrophomonadaceae bacterium]
MDWLQLDELIRRALVEDIGHGDLTTDSIVSPGQRSEGVILVKRQGVVAGLEVARRVFVLLDAEVRFEAVVGEGSQVEPGTVVARLQGPTRSILTGERVALNFLQRMSGIATHTRRLVTLLAGERACLVDTRKTTPGLRALEKYAVRVGGGRNHRFGLFDGVIIKDNHIVAAGSIAAAVAAVRARVPHTVKVEVEVEDLLMLEQALEAGADIVMLDNMDPPTMRRAVEVTAGRALLEASGGISEANLLEVARTGVDFISMGALTHSSPALDISMDLL